MYSFDLGEANIRLIYEEMREQTLAMSSLVYVTRGLQNADLHYEKLMSKTHQMQ